MRIELSKAVELVRDELLAATSQADFQGIELAVGAIELEFSVEFKQDAKVKGGVKAWVLSGDAEAGMSRGRTNKVKISLTPRRADGADVLVTGQERGQENGEEDAGGGPGDVAGRIGR